ncbi:MAG TPA: MerR family transcriptional regulator [Casimicrobiaceae bacterium]|nr:MerR family transcriptional regulator [Casimicrobiaceae bacterium]
MNNTPEPAGLVLNISAVERETSFSKDVLRIWERRYGFPKPDRDDNGERQYNPADIAKLRAIKRLMDVGMRPGKLMMQSLDQLNALAESRAAPRPAELAPALERDVLALLKSHDNAGLQHTIANLLMKEGMQKFVLDTLNPLNRAVGEAWMRGELQVFEEHLYTESLQAALRVAINAFPRHPGTPRVLLTTFPNEQHGLGLLGVEALLVPEGVQCISLGTQTPLEDIRRAVLAHKVHILALSFSAAFAVRHATDGLASLRRQVPPQVTIWAGGEMTRRIRKTMSGVVLIPDLASTVAALRSWRSHWVPQVAGY